MAGRRQRAVLARKLKEEGCYPTFHEVCDTPDPARYYTDANDHNPLVIDQCGCCDGSGWENGTVDEVCSCCLGVGIVSDQPMLRFNENFTLIEVPVDDEGWLVCPHCTERFNIHNPKEWTGLRHQLCGQKIKPTITGG